MLEQTDAIMNEVLEPITFILAHPTVHWILKHQIEMVPNTKAIKIPTTHNLQLQNQAKILFCDFCIK
jgi:hypothetical protein